MGKYKLDDGLCRAGSGRRPASPDPTRGNAGDGLGQSGGGPADDWGAARYHDVGAWPSRPSVAVWDQPHDRGYDARRLSGSGPLMQFAVQLVHLYD